MQKCSNAVTTRRFAPVRAYFLDLALHLDSDLCERRVFVDFRTHRINFAIDFLATGTRIDLPTGTAAQTSRAIAFRWTRRRVSSSVMFAMLGGARGFRRIASSRSPAESPSSSRTRVSKLAWIVARDSAASFSMRGTPSPIFLEPGLEVASQCRALATALQVERFDRTLHRLQGDIDSRPGIVFLLDHLENLGPLQIVSSPSCAVELEPLAQPAQLTDVARCLDRPLTRSRARGGLVTTQRTKASTRPRSTAVCHASCESRLRVHPIPAAD